MLTPAELKKIVKSKYFERFILFVIISAGILVGLQTYPDFSASNHNLIVILDTLIVVVFVIEALLKIASEMPHPLNYFKNSWNVFDFIIVVGVLLPLESSFLPALRLLRVLRVFRIVTTIPKLRLIVGALLKSIPSMMHIFLLLGIIFYIFAVMATFTYSGNDPVHFKDLPTSILTLFRMVTFDSWSEIMYINMYGCDKYGYEGAMTECTNPSASPVGAALFFTIFVIISGLIVLNLVIGVIINSMDEMKEEMANEYPGYDHLAGKQKQEEIIQYLNKIDKKLDSILEERR